MREGIDCKGRKWVERELKGTAKDITGQTCENLTAILPIYYENKQVGYVNVNVAMRLLQLYLNGAM